MTETLLADATTLPAAQRRFSVTAHRGLAPVGALWRAMEQHGALTAYQRLSWVELVAAHLVAKEGAEVLVAEVRDAATGTPLMLLPFQLRRLRTHAVIEWLSCGVCDYAAPVMASGLVLSPIEAQAAWTAVLAALPRADLLEIDGICAQIDGAPNPLALLPSAAPSALSASGLVMDGEPEILIARVCKPSLARDLAANERRLAKRGEIRFVTAQTPQEADELFSALLEQRLARFRKLGRHDLLAEPRAAEFYRAAVRGGVEGGPMRIFGLRCGDAWVALAAGLVHRGTYCGCLLSIGDDEWRNVSPGLMVIARTMVRTREMGLAYHDFTVGAFAYKEAFGTVAHQLYRIEMALTARGRLVKGLHNGSAAAESWIRARPRLAQRLVAARHGLRRLSSR